MLLWRRKKKKENLITLVEVSFFPQVDVLNSHELLYGASSKNTNKKEMVISKEHYHLESSLFSSKKEFGSGKKNTES